MSVEPDEVQQDYRREERREHKAMESKLPGAKFNANTLSRAFDDNRSVGSAKSQKHLPAALFFQNAVAKIAAPIGPACQVGTFPLLDENWRTWFADTNAARLSDFDKCNVESLNQVIRHNNAAIDKMEDLLEKHQGTDGEEASAALATVQEVLQYVYVANDQAKCMLDDFGQKWSHTAQQFEINRKFARAHNPTDDSMAAGPGIYDPYRRQVNAYGQISVYKRECSQLVPPKAALPAKTDWREGSAAKSAKSKKQQPQQQMAAAAVPARPVGGRGGPPRPPAAVPIVAAAVIQ